MPMAMRNASGWRQVTATALNAPMEAPAAMISPWMGFSFAESGDEEATSGFGVALEALDDHSVV